MRGRERRQTSPANSSSDPGFPCHRKLVLAAAKKGRRNEKAVKVSLPEVTVPPSELNVAP